MTATTPVKDKLDPRNIKGTPEWGEKIRKQARDLSRQLDSGYMELGEILWVVYDTPTDGRKENGPIYESWGYKSFGQYAEEELNLQRRKAERLRSIWHKIEVELSSLDRQTKRRLVALGWSKVRELVPVLGLNNAAEWADLGEKMNYPSLCAAIQQYKQKVDSSRAITEPVSEDADEPGDLPAIDNTIDPDEFKLSDKHFYALKVSEKEIIEEALNRAAQISHSESASRNLAAICVDFLATNDFRKSDDPDSLARYFHRLEAAVGFKFIVADPKTNRVVYGLSTLEKLARPEGE